VDLRGVARAGTGLDNIDVETARARGIEVVNAPAANAISVAELVFALLLALERQLVPAATALAAGRWEKSRFMGRELHGKTLGLVGFGRIGRDVAQRARAFGMRVDACDPVLSHWPIEFDWVAPRTLEALLRDADVISLHLPLTPESRGLIGERELARMKPDAVLVNAARGGVVDEAALHHALSSGKLRGAALDVFAQEPPGEHPLLSLPNVIATPHLGAATHEAQARAGIEAAERLLEAMARATAGR
jgi:D-3-phosphoglycerate dehydrogenase